MARAGIRDVIFWFCMAILICYILAKLFGLINTPEWINLIPLVTIAFLVGIFYQEMKDFEHQMYIRTDYLKSKLENHENRLSALETN